MRTSLLSSLLVVLVSVPALVCVPAALAAPGASGEAAGVDEAPTFSHDIAPIFFAHCAECHRPGQVAPMSLLSYAEARPWAKSIARMVLAKKMPPFSPESERLHFQNDQTLEQETIERIVAWVKAGAPEGDPADLPEPPAFTDGWTLGEPDYVITLDEVAVPAEGDDLFLKQWLTLDLDRTRWVRAIEFLPGNRRLTHHFQATYNTPRTSTAEIGQSDYQGEGAGGNGVFGIWTAGMPPYVFPEGMGRIVTPQTKILVDSHYHPYGEAGTDQTRIGLYWGEGELEKEVATMVVANTGLRIPPGAASHAEHGYHVFDTDMQILAFSPHMHVRGKAMRYDLTYPDGHTETLLDVPRYDYNWQWLYYPTEPVDVPAGSRLEVTAVWDNSSGNPFNPDPTEEIIYRGDTFHEMFVGFFEAIQKDGVYHHPPPKLEKLTSLLAQHEPADAYLVKGFMPFGFFAPKEGEGWLYLVQGITMFTISLDDIRWHDGALTIHTQFPTPEASAITTVLELAADEQGRLAGTLAIGADTERPLELRIVAQPMSLLGANGTPSAGL